MGYILPCFRALTIWGFSICFTWKLCWPAVWAASCATFDLGNETSTSSPFLLLFHLYCFWPFKWRKIHWIKKLCMCIYVHLDPKTKKRKKDTLFAHTIFFWGFGVLVFYVNFENYFPGQLVAKCWSRQYFSNCCNGSVLLIIILNNFLPNFANTFSRQYFWANCCCG